MCSTTFTTQIFPWDKVNLSLHKKSMQSTNKAIQAKPFLAKYDSFSDENN